MAGPEPRVDYNPVPSVEPTTQAPNDTLSVRASPESFGAQVGEANVGLGKSVSNLGSDVTNQATAYQGILNEYSANQADMSLAVDGGKVDSQYKLNEGFAAANTKDKAIQDYLDVNQKIRDSLNPAAARAYDQLANRRIAYTVQGMNDYASTQVKSALKQGSQASIQMTEDTVSKYGIASDPAQFGYQVGSLKHDLNDLLTNPAKGGPLAGLPVSQSADGTLKFNTDTPEGSSAQAYYNNNLNVEMGKIWTNRVNAIATDLDHGSYVSAMKMLQDNQSSMPASTFRELSSKFYPLAQTERIHGNNESILANVNSDYLNQSKLGPSGETPQEVPAAKTVTNLFPGSVITSEQRSPEHNAAVGGVPDSMHLTGNAIDFVPPAGTTIDQVRSGFLSQGITPTELLNEGDHFHVAWAGQGTGTGTGARPTDFVDFVNQRAPQLIAQARQDSANAGQDATYQDQAAQAMQTRISELNTAKNTQARSLSDDIISKVMDPKNPVTNMYTLMYGDSQTRQEWATAISLNPYLERTVNDLVTANASGQSKTYGSDIYKVVQDTLTGKVSDPSQYSNYGIGSDKAPLSESGFMMVSKELENSQSPSGKAFAIAESNFLERLHSQYTGYGQIPGVGQYSSSAAFNQAMSEVMPKIQAGVSAGKTADQLFNPKSPDYIQSSVKTPNPEDLQKNYLYKIINTGGTGTTVPVPQGTPNPNPQVFNPKAFDTIKDAKSGGVALKAFIDSSNNKRQAYKQAHDYGIQRGWFQPDAPSVPKPQ